MSPRGNKPGKVHPDPNDPLLKLLKEHPAEKHNAEVKAVKTTFGEVAGKVIGAQKAAQQLTRSLYLRKQQGILGPETDPVGDADVIMTAAVVGHAYERLKAGKNCRFDVEVKDAPRGAWLKTKLEIADNIDFRVHDTVVKQINMALAPQGLRKKKLKVLDKQATVKVGVTPIYDKKGNFEKLTGGSGDKKGNRNRITGGSGDKGLTDKHRYDPKLPKGLAGELYQLAVGHQGASVGYQGRGAYTGFIDGRKGGQTGLMSTYCHAVLKRKDWGKRWIPDASSWALDDVVKKMNMGSKIGKGQKERIWGMIIDNATQRKLKEIYGMYFQDEPAKLTEKDIVGYTHGMIQAIYDVVWREGGKPYEIAVGQNTTKLASCFPCAIFMEANGYPASSTHLGRGESWLPQYPENTTDTTQNRARTQCNDKWAVYCTKIMSSGLRCIKTFVESDHEESFTALEAYVEKNKNRYDCANLILDAITVHESDYKRIHRTLKLPKGESRIVQVAEAPKLD